jgi:hypothetical protein
MGGSISTVKVKTISAALQAANAPVGAHKIAGVYWDDVARRSLPPCLAIVHPRGSH